MVRADPTIPCPGGPDPLRFRPEAAIAALAAGTARPVAVSATVDPVTGREWVAVAFLDPSEEVAVTVSGNGGCDFGDAAGGMDPVVVSQGSAADAVSVALRVEGGAPLLAVGWHETAGGVMVRTTGLLDGTFGAAVRLDDGGAGGPALAIAPAPAAAVLGAAWIDLNASSTREAFFARNPAPLDTAAWEPSVPMNDALGADLGAGAEIALAADAAGSGGGAGFTVLATSTFTGQAAVRRSDDAGSSFAAWRRVDDGSYLGAPSGISLAAGGGPGPGPQDSSWTGLAWNGQDAFPPSPHEIAADAALVDAGTLGFDFDGIAGGGNVVQQEPVPQLSATASAVVGGAPGDNLFALWTDAGEVQGARRPLDAARPNLQGGCGPFQLTGLSPPRAAGIAADPAASALGPDLVLVFSDDRSGAPELFFKRSDSTPPDPSGLEAVPSDCGDPPRVQLDWDPPACDVVRQVVEVGTAPGGTDFTREAGTAGAYLVEGLEPGVTYYFRITAFDSAGNQGTSSEASAETPSCSDALLDAGIVDVTDACAFGAAGGDGRVDPGENATLRISVRNIGTDTAAGVALRLLSRSPYVTIRTGPQNLGDLDPAAAAEADFDFDLSATAPCGTDLEVLAVAESGGAAWSDLLTVAVPGSCTVCASAACSVTADATLSAPLEFCRNEAVTLDAGDSSAIDCAGILLYQWWDGNNLVSTAASVDRTPNNSRTYRLVATCSTDFDCSDETTVDVTVNQLPPVSFAEDPPPPHCAGDTVTLTASTSDPAATFTWSTGADTPGIDLTEGGVYSVTVVDSNGCSRARSYRIDFGEIPPADAGPDPVSCAPVAVGTPGFPLLDYRWDPPDGLSNPNTAQPVASPATATLYTLTVTDPTSGCYATDEVLVDLAPVPGPVSGLLLGRDPDLLRFAWDPDPDAPTTRIYSETEVAAARDANGSSPTALLECEGALDCQVPLPAGGLILYQAVGLCAGGALEGPN